MPGSHYSYLDLTVLAPLRRKVLASEATLLFSADLRHVLWANAAGANLFGGADIAELIETPVARNQPFMRQLHDAAGQIAQGDTVVRGLRIARGLRSDLVRCELSWIVLPGGERALLLDAAETRTGRPPREHELADAAVRSLSGYGSAAALLDEYGLTIAATDSFAGLELPPEDLGRLVGDASADRLVKRMLEGPDGEPVATGVARLRDRPGRFLLVCVAAGSDESARQREPQAGEAVGAEPDNAAEEAAVEAETAQPGPQPVAEPPARKVSLLERWYSGLLDEPPAAPAGRRKPEAQPPEPQPPAPQPPEPLTAPAEDAAPVTAEAEPAAAAEVEPPASMEVEPPVPLEPALPEAEPDEVPAPVAGHVAPTAVPPPPEQPAGAADFVFENRGEAVRFAWIIDADQTIRSVSPELARTVGPNAADIVGRKWADVAAVFGFDQAGDIRRLLEKGDTWSGKTVLWPVQGTDLVVPVELAALPSFSAARRFDGFRGFGIIRAADAMVDRNETGLALVPGRPLPPAAAEPMPEEATIEARRVAPAPAEPRAPERGGAKVVDLASRKRIETREELSRRESQAFSEIGRTLRDGDGAPGERPEPAEAEPPPEPPTAPEGRPAEATASILAQLPVPVLVYRNGETLFANAELLKATGYPSAQAIGEAGGIDALLEGGEGQAALIARDGRRVPIAPHLQSVPWQGGKALLLSFRHPEQPSQERIALDIARVAELQNILDTATDGIIIASRDGMIESLNASAEALFGVDHARVAGNSLTVLFAQESHKPLGDYIADLSEPGVASILNDGRELIGKEANGGLIPLFVTIGRVGASEKFCLVLRDMTQWKKAEEELVNARRAAETASEQKTDFLARVSHEIRTPLNAIIGFSDVMLEERFGPVGNERYREYLRDINRSGVHVLDLINDLLDISKIEAGKMDLTYEAVDLNQLVAETVALLQPQANRERIIIRTSLSRAVPRVVADARSIRQIILNLVSNAIKFTPENGQVIVSTVYEGNGEVALRVRDTGRGMSKQEIETAMKPFHQVRPADARRGQGTGLGLPLTKALVEANRAYFDLESEPGEGTIAHVHFPTQRVLAD